MNTLPHMGELIKKRIIEKKISFSEVARRMKVSQPTISNYFHQSSLQTKVLFNISIAIEHNLFADIMQYLPQNIQNANNTTFHDTIIQQQEQIAELSKEINIYKQILNNNK
ncbi:hypothetical protein [Flavobacterium macrobrachii]|uniref:HTH cro/C1-type domain-containing protein n=1 Tax=Flavobacterium macrobrachii TaxID=591204 RepID=A0ABS2D2B2_9FLAO|nr:hypothetical protein [Flavobacterium macrobrachii]MBM6500592.1 hypothetical protein [Flavobacterium macrobrachii]PZO27832.1 MAG: hypothetical protein DCF13_10740 [Flavobacteriaceae bacterium]